MTQPPEHMNDAVSDGFAALLEQARRIWGPSRHTVDEIAIRLIVGVGDIARVTRDAGRALKHGGVADEARRELKKELGNLIFSTVRWIDDLGLDVMECLDLAVEAQERFAKSGRPR